MQNIDNKPKMQNYYQPTPPVMNQAVFNNQ